MPREYARGLAGPTTSVATRIDSPAAGKSPILHPQRRATCNAAARSAAPRRRRPCRRLCRRAHRRPSDAMALDRRLPQLAIESASQHCNRAERREQKIKHLHGRRHTRKPQVKRTARLSLHRS